MLIDGMRRIGFEPLLPAALQAPIIVTFLMPKAAGFDFGRFYDGLKQKGYVIYPGKLTQVDSFRMGCIGDLHPEDMRDVLMAVETTLVEMGVSLHPAALAGGARR